HHDRTQKRDDRLPTLVIPGCPHPNDAHAISGFGVALLQHLARGMNRVTFEDWRGQAYLVPSKIRKSVLADIGDADSCDQREGKARIHEWSSKFGLGG